MESKNIFELRAEVRRLKKQIDVTPICVMRRAECLALIQLYTEMKDKFDAIEKKKHIRCDPRPIPVANEIVDGCEMKIPEIPKERVVPNSLKKKQSTIIREDKDGREE